MTTPHMSLDAFLTAFAACANAYRWHVDAGTGDLRGTGAGQRTFCPLTAVVFARRRVYRHPGVAVDAGMQHLGLCWAEADTLAAAADALHAHDPAVRHALLTAVGLADGIREQHAVRLDSLTSSPP